MRTRDTFDVMCSTAAIVADMLAIYAGFILAYWIRFYTNLIPVLKGYPPPEMYFLGSAVAVLLFLFIFRALGLFVRPQIGTFGDKFPRLIRACGRPRSARRPRTSTAACPARSPRRSGPSTRAWNSWSAGRPTPRCPPTPNGSASSSSGW